MKIWLYAGKSGESQTTMVTLPHRGFMPSKNVLSADNQQERLKIIGQIVGFTDGEGCFSISIFKNRTTNTGWQVMPEFVVTQGEKSIKSLQELQKFFGCGKIFINHRYDNHHEHLYRYCVRTIKDLREKIIPFFEENQLKTAKKKDFDKFKLVAKLMESNLHWTLDGIESIKKIAKS